ncbi:hypothetical protein EJ110_NYTH27768 [Nymphaea thermarum]|nr:hypothetical protein EJ110_NYTH27768 [Nymphaea thermarum]
MDRRIGSSGSSKYWDVNPEDIDVDLEGEHDLHALNMDLTEPVAPSNLDDLSQAWIHESKNNRGQTQLSYLTGLGYKQCLRASGLPGLYESGTELAQHSPTSNTKSCACSVIMYSSKGGVPVRYWYRYGTRYTNLRC